MAKPLIGITAYDYYKPNGWRYDVCYGQNAAAIERAGGLPVLIPSKVSQDVLRGIYERLDAVLLPGGGDINPTYYNATEEAELHQVDDERDSMELSLTRWAVEDDRPVFGICRGIQVMNVALGGTLIQDIPTQYETDLRHSLNFDINEPRHTLLHDVRVENGTRLASILGDSTVTVNSIHHQAIQQLADGMSITAKSPDGIIEGMEMRDKHFVLAVQWHPEDLTENDERMQNLFNEFVKAAAERINV